MHWCILLLGLSVLLILIWFLNGRILRSFTMVRRPAPGPQTNSSPVERPSNTRADSVPVTVGSGQTTQAEPVGANRDGFLEVVLLRHSDRQPLPEINVAARSEKHEAAVISGKNGVSLLRLPVGQYQVWAYRSRWRTMVVSQTVNAGQTNRVEFEVSPPIKVTGTVRQPDGQPAAGVEVRIVPSRPPAGGVYPTTDATGLFETDWDPQRDGRADMQSRVIVRDPARGWAAAADIEEGIGALELKLAPGLELAGRVQSPDGQPATNFTAVLVFRSGNAGFNMSGLAARANSPGRFEFFALPPDGHYGLMISAPGFGQTIMNEITAEPVDGRVEVELTLGQELAGSSTRSRFIASEPVHHSLLGSPLPDLAAVGLATNALASGKPGLVCLLDCEQRPSRRLLRQLTEQYGALTQKGLGIVAVQVAVISDESWQSFQESATLPFAVGRVTEKSKQSRWATASDSLPWFILVDGKGKVAAEGFSLDELEPKLQRLRK